MRLQQMLVCVLLVLGLTISIASALPYRDICLEKENLYIKYLDNICTEDGLEYTTPPISSICSPLVRLYLHSTAKSVCKCFDDLKHHKWLSVDCGLLIISSIPELGEEEAVGELIGKSTIEATEAIKEIEILDEMGGETIKNFRRWTTYPAVRIGTIVNEEKGKIYDLYLVYNMKRNGLIDEEVWIKEYPLEFGPASEVKIMKLKIKGRKGIVTYWDRPIGEWR